MKSSSIWKDIIAPLIPIITFFIGVCIEPIRTSMHKHRKYAYEALTYLYQPLYLYLVRKTPIHITQDDFPLDRNEFEFIIEKVENYSYLMSRRSLKIFNKILSLLNKEEYFLSKSSSLKIPPLALGDMYIKFYNQIEAEYWALCYSLKTRAKLESIMKKYDADNPSDNKSCD